MFEYFQRCCDFPGAGLFQYISFRAAMAVITSLVITLLFGKRWIKYLNRRQVGETVRDLGL
ncbi:MAG: phospho-N-acetylmuramoyl-pentapeptide-transferase, partial [Bacteroidales bacterium]|nr:phospho-N-acetylmuramoyl-pentapeptide-transferase [Bacteroidales bacterium]